mmetsp:Transcript_60299/g.54299  ORF Transcript_60299/g.54299 Transcript_60299/m.54299 type:complete len:238 (-) Transcript_60299:35-748(-)
MSNWLFLIILAFTIDIPTLYADNDLADFDLIEELGIDLEELGSIDDDGLFFFLAIIRRFKSTVEGLQAQIDDLTADLNAQIMKQTMENTMTNARIDVLTSELNEASIVDPYIALTPAVCLGAPANPVDYVPCTPIGKVDFFTTPAFQLRSDYIRADGRTVTNSDYAGDICADNALGTDRFGAGSSEVCKTPKVEGRMVIGSGANDGDTIDIIKTDSEPGTTGGATTLSVGATATFDA